MREVQLDQRETHDRLTGLELEHDLLRFEVDGWRIWPLFRWLVAFGISKSGSSFSTVEEPWTHRQRVGIAAHDLGRVIRPGRKRFLVVANATNRSEQIDGQYWDIYFDDVLSKIDSFIKLEHPNSRAFRVAGARAAIPSDLTSTLITAVASARARRGPDGLDAPAAELSAILAKEGIEGFTAPRVSRFLKDFYWQKRYYRAFMRRVRPKHLLIVNPYGDHAVVAAAKEERIQVVEFQHGALDRYHPGYSWTAASAHAKQTMPIPDRIFLYGDHWRRELEQAGFWTDELRVVGSPRIDRFRGRELPRFDIPTLAVTMQAVDVAKVVDFIRRFLALAGQQNPVQVFLKLHPTENPSEIYRSVGDDPRIKLITSAGEPSTFELLARSRFHASVASTCHLEAVALGTRTVILPFTFHEMMLHLRDDESVFFAETPEQLFEIFTERHASPSRSMGEDYFQPGALENMLRELSP